MRKIKYIILMTLCVLGITACQDDLIDNPSVGGVDINKPVKVDLKFGIPKSMEVEVSRADNSNSNMRNVRLYVFSGNTLLSTQEVSITTNGTETNNGRSYTVSATLYVGTQTVYAIGNTSTSYWDSNTIDVIDEAAQEGKDELEQVLYTLNSTVSDNNFPNFVTGHMPLSGFGDVTVSNDGTTKDVVRLGRLLAQIKFNIDTEYSGEGKNVTFEPSNYAFYNVATKAYVLGGLNKTVLDEDVYKTTPVTSFDRIEGGRSFSVFIPENIQTVKSVADSKCMDYDDRESFKGEGEDKIWIFAPDKATYVVLKGVCRETDSSGKLLRYGDVEYTIHLGDFDDYPEDFSVERNCIYTYGVSVRGMDNIVIEAEKEKPEDGYQNGAEGNVIELGTASKMFSLDSHYEQVFVEYNLTDIYERVRNLNSNANMDEEEDVTKIKRDIARQFILSVHSPMNEVSTIDELRFPYSEFEDMKSDMNGIDEAWIEFYPQENDESISLYPGKGNGLYSPSVICKKMGEAVYDMFENPGQAPKVEGLTLKEENGDWVARFTIFVDEYFYKTNLAGETVAWGDFTGKGPRTMLIASDMEISDDKNSTYATAQTYITQRAIETFYRPESDYNTNALGLETYNENGVISGFGSAQASSDDWSNGRVNMLINTGLYSRGSWQNNVNWWNDQSNSGFVNFTQIGYIDDNLESGNKWTNAGNQNNAYYACLSRNRDLNGNHVIDGDEVRWYLPALSQYLRIGIGTKALSNETQLYTGDKSQMTVLNNAYPSHYLKDGALYFVNTSDPRDGGSFTLYWAVEVGSYGSPSMGKNGAMIRCVRNLPMETVVAGAVDSDSDIKLVDYNALAGPVYGELLAINSGNQKNAVFNFGDRLVETIFRPGYISDPYSPHTEEDDQEMMLPGAFVVAAQNIRVSDAKIAFGTYGGDYRWGYDPCSTYSEENDESDEGVWRTPNLNELMVMSTVNDVLDLNVVRNGRDETKVNVFSRTRFSNDAVRPGFYLNYSDMITVNGENEWATDGNQYPTGDIGGSGYVRCVRDATAEDLQAATSY